MYNAVEVDGMPGIIGKVFVLQKDGRECPCPYQTPLMGQSNLGQQTIFRMPCHTACHFAEIKEAKGIPGGMEYCVSCGGLAKYFALDAVKKIPTPEEKEESMLIKMPR